MFFAYKGIVEYHKNPVCFTTCTKPPGERKEMEVFELKCTTRFADFEARFLRMEEEIRILKTDRANNRLAADLADSITAVVGVKEMLTGRRRAMKWIWGFLFCLGIFGTSYYVYAGAKEYLDNQTATNVELRRQPSYAFPSLVLCPGSWIDTKKAYEKGLSKEALRYAMAHLAWEFGQDPSMNISRARHDFRQFYHAHNYSSLLNFYTDMAVDPIHADSASVMSKLDTAAYSCSGCVDDEPLEKVVVRDMMCFAFKFKPADARHVQTFVADRQVIFQMKNEQDPDFPVTTNWFAYLMSDTHILQPKFPSMSIDQFAVSTLKTRVMNFLGLNNDKDDDRKCIDSDKDIPVGYSPERCAVKCLHELLEQRTGCGIFYYSAYDESEHPAHYCNFYEPLPKMDNMTFTDFKDTREENISLSDESAQCVRRCPNPCHREIYASTFDSKFTIVLDDSNVTANARARNMSLVVVSVDHEAVGQGGVMTLTEVRTYSFATLVSNVGGTLGLFVGGTIMTFFQVILWAVDYCLDAKSGKKKIEQKGRAVV